MLRSLTWKLTLAFLLVALTAALLLAVVIRLTSAGQLDRLIVEQRRNELQALLADYYQTTGSWVGVQAYLRQMRFDQRFGEADLRPLAGRRDRRELFGLADADGDVIIPLRGEYPPGARVPPNVLARGEPVVVDGQTVGVILTADLPPGLNPEEVAYLQRTTAALALAGVGAVIVAVLVGVWLARTLTRPLRALTNAAHRMASGELEQAVDVRSEDEIGELAAAFNRMSREVARANQARKQMTADVAHELRTPLTVIAGYIESMRDGVLAATPERLSVIYAEIERLQHLVGDLRTLSQADAGELKLNLEPVSPAELLEQTQAAFAHQAEQKGVALRVEAERNLPAVNGDEIRLLQVLSNLVSNALRYTPAGGQIVLSATMNGDRQVALSVRDTGPGIAPEDLPFIFNRFYRADKARAGEGGESGLGLAIAKALAEAHGGALTVQSVLGQGSTFTLQLPAKTNV
ncbi:MAG: ATP-binding protein [Anaerolineales bacterium]|nr:ATP-binding protein [Anaerolineales bacterium]